MNTLPTSADFLSEFKTVINANEGSVTGVIRKLQDGDRDSAEQLWNHYHARLVALARKKLHSRVRRVVDEEDVVLQAIDECFRSVEAGRYPSLQDRDNLWALLAKITERRALNANREAAREKRGGGLVRGDSVFLRQDESVCFGPDATPAREPTPEMIAELTEAFEDRLSQLSGMEQSVALKKLQGFRNKEIAERLGCSIASVERKLKLIREKWAAHDS